MIDFTDIVLNNLKEEPDELSADKVLRFIDKAKALEKVAGFKCDRVPYHSQIPLYEELDDKQLNWYLYFRMNLRQNIFLEADTSYIFLYIFEIINQIGIKNPKEGMDILVKLIKKYHKSHPVLQRKAYNILRDYALAFYSAPLYLNFISEAFGEDSVDYMSDEMLCYFFDVQSRVVNYKLWEKYSFFKIRNGLVETEEKKELLERCLANIFLNINEKYKEQNSKKSILNAFIPTNSYAKINLFENMPFQFKISVKKEEFNNIGSKISYKFIKDEVYTNYNKVFAFYKETNFKNFMTEIIEYTGKYISYLLDEDDKPRTIYLDKKYVNIIEDISDRVYEEYIDDDEYYEDDDFWNFNDREKEFYEFGIQNANIEEKDGSRVNFKTSYYHDKPSYKNLNKNQLKWYYTWRTNVRKGIYLDTDVDYIRIYISEIINQIGIKKPEEGLEILLELINNYKKDLQYTYFNFNIIKDYIIYYNLDSSLLENYYKRCKADHMLLVVNYTNLLSNKNTEKFLESLSYVLSYKITNSSFVNSGYEVIVEQALKEVLIRINEKINLLKTISIKSKSTWEPFYDSIFYDRKKKIENYEINNYIKYWYENKKYYSNEEAYITAFYNYLKAELNEIVRYVENELRIKLNYKTKLKPMLVNEQMKQIIKETVDKKLQKYDIVQVGKKFVFKEKEKFKVDVTKLEKLKKEANEIRDRIIKEQEEVEEKPKVEIVEEKRVIERDEKSPYQSFIFNLKDYELQFVKSIINEEYSNLMEISKSQNKMKETIIDEINEVAFGHIGDNVIGENTIYDEYLVEIKKEIEWKI